ncbi:Myeloid leukemia factor 1 [Gossypium arboreum]|uniref:Myeloid leukemia factor 1 n=1 Tax=Gossypium arboreum TaxID=29729 RepID=A0A0B0NEF9_GOSAR|nr:Myeloid leukemia factor 1 [Gossypium arboreum]
MQGGRGGRDPFFEFGGDPFGAFGGHKNLLSNFFNGRDPFDDPFFTRPFDSMFESSFFGPGHNPFPDMHPSGFIEQQAPEPRRPRGPIIQELDSDDEKEMKENPRKQGRSKDEPHVEVPDDETEQSERRNGHLQYMNGYNGSYQRQQQPPQTRSFTFQSSTVTYGGANGAYYTSSKTRRSGSDGITFEESKEANTATGQASHRVSRGLLDKGHSFTRKLNSDGRVETMQTLHNLNEDELTGFEEAWNGNARKHLPGWSGSSNVHDTTGTCWGQNGQASHGGRALPSTERSQQSGKAMMDAKDSAGPSSGQNSTKAKGLGALKDKISQTLGKKKNQV